MTRYYAAEYKFALERVCANGELGEPAIHKKFLLVRQEGKRQVQREINHYNLDMIIALGYRVQSPVAVRFRRWETQRLHEYIQKDFTMNNERLKQGGKILQGVAATHPRHPKQRSELFVDI